MSKLLPHYQMVMNYYQNLIETGKLVEGDKMPTEEELCNLFNISRITVRRALDGLTQEGYIYKIQGKGSYVTVKKTDMQLDRLQGFSEEMRSMGLTPSSQLISVQITEPTENVMRALQIEQNQKVYAITRLRLADNAPIAIECVHLAFYRFYGLDTHDLSRSLYEILRHSYNCEKKRAVQSIRAAAATVEDARWLQIKQGKAVLQITRTTYDQDGKPFEYTQSIYRGDRYQFNVTIE